MSSNVCVLSHVDLRWMRAALALAKQAEGRTSPNPMVGAVVVKGGDLVGAGWHHSPGEPHAEVLALDQAGDCARGATLYVTLEPCCHHGRTPPCTDRIIAAGISRVVAAVRDPNPSVDGGGFARLQAAGISVDCGLLAQEAKVLNRAFFTWVTQRRPYVHLKTAQSLDGKVATATQQSRWITGPAARFDAHTLRARVDAILVGVGTVLADDPRLTARPEGEIPAKQPLRVVLDSRGRTPPNARCLDVQTGKAVVATTRKAPEPALARLRDRGVTVWIDPSPAGERVNVQLLLRYLADQGAASVMVEGGPTVAGAMMDAGVVDEVHAYIAPFLIGGVAAPGSVAGTGIDWLHKAHRLKEGTWITVGKDMRFNGRVPRGFLGDGEAED